MRTFLHFAQRTFAYAFFLNAALTVSYAQVGAVLSVEKLLTTLAISVTAGALATALHGHSLHRKQPEDTER